MKINKFVSHKLGIKKHHHQQIAYFQREFSRIKEYRLAAWQKGYIERIKKYLLDKDFKNKILIDIATGSGYVAIEMAKLGMKVVACDLSPQAIKNLAKFKKEFRLSNLRLIRCFAEEIPLEDESVDYVVANAILEHIPDEKKAIAEWKRILKPSGKMFIAVPLKYQYLWPFLWPLNYLHDKRIGHLRRYDLESLEKKFSEKVSKFFYTGHLLKVLGAIISLVFRLDLFDRFFEEYDRRLENCCWGASNLVVIFQKRGGRDKF